MIYRLAWAVSSDTLCHKVDAEPGSYGRWEAPMRLLRLLRGAIGMGLTWALGWAGAGMLVRTIFGPGTGDLPLPIRFAMFGFLSGVTFSGVLTLVAGRRRFDEMSVGRFAGLGAAGGLLLFGLLAATAGPGGEPLWQIPVFVLTGAVSAAGTLMLARAGEARLLAADVPLDSIDSGAGEH